MNKIAERRMFAKSIVVSDDFLDMPATARCLYFTLGMFADDDGFVNNPKSIMRQSGSTTDDMNILIAKKYVIAFESGVIVIRHWRIHNYIKSDRYHGTVCIDEKKQLSFSGDGKVYEKTVEIPTMVPECIQDGSKMDTEVSRGKDSLDKDSVGEVESTNPNAPTLKEVIAYCKEKNLLISPEYYFNSMEADNWCRFDKRTKSMVPISNWKKSILNWDKQERKNPAPKREETKEPDWDYFIGDGND